MNSIYSFGRKTAVVLAVTVLCIAAPAPFFSGIASAEGLDWDYDYNYGYNDYDYSYGYNDYSYGYGYSDYDYDYGYSDYSYDYGYNDYSYDYGYNDYSYDYGYSDYSYDYGYNDYSYDYGYNDYSYDYGYNDYSYDYGYDFGYTDYFDAGYTDYYDAGYTDYYVDYNPGYTDYAYNPGYTDYAPVYTYNPGYTDYAYKSYPEYKTYTYTTPTYYKSYPEYKTTTYPVVYNPGVPSIPEYQKPNCTIYANVSAVNYGGNVTVSWTSNYATSASLSGVGTVSANGSYTQHNMTGAKTFTLTVTGQGGSNTCQTSVTVQQQQAAPYCTLYASPSSVQAGGSTLLTWTSQNATSAYLSEVGTVSLNGTYQAHNLHSTKTYTLTVYGQGGTNTCTTSVGVYSTPTPPPYVPPVTPGNPYISLTQIPYTGFDFGPWGNALYWFGMIAWAGGAAYAVVAYRTQMLNFAYGLIGRKSATVLSENSIEEEETEAADNNEVTETDEVEEVNGDAMVMDYSSGMPRLMIKRSATPNLPIN